MSTVPGYCGPSHGCDFGVSIITDMGNEESIDTISHDEVLEAAQKAEPKVRNLIKSLILNY
jgi:purine-nucleoside phosphorylase